MKLSIEKKQGEELDRVNDFREIMETIPKRLIGDDDDNAYILGKSSLDVTVNDKGIVMGNNNDKSLITSNNRDIKFRVYTKYITRPNHGDWLNTSYIFHIIIDDEKINKKNNVLIGISGDMRADKVFETYFNMEYNTILDHSNARYILLFFMIFHTQNIRGVFMPLNTNLIISILKNFKSGSLKFITTNHLHLINFNMI